MKIADATKLAKESLKGRDPKAAFATAIEFYKERVRDMGRAPRSKVGRDSRVGRGLRPSRANEALTPARRRPRPTGANRASPFTPDAATSRRTARLSRGDDVDLHVLEAAFFRKPCRLLS